MFDTISSQFSLSYLNLSPFCVPVAINLNFIISPIKLIYSLFHFISPSMCQGQIQRTDALPPFQMAKHRSVIISLIWLVPPPLFKMSGSIPFGPQVCVFFSPVITYNWIFKHPPGLKKKNDPYFKFPALNCIQLPKDSMNLMIWT